MILAALAFSSAAFAQTKAPEPDYTLAYNVGVVTDYRFRGISQTRLKPALQGGIDFTHSSGFYLGFWGSTIKVIEDTYAGADGPVELDFYGGYRGKFSDTVSYDLGLLRYQYPKQNLPAGAATFNTTELYGAVTFGPATVKYSHSIGDETFGVANSRGSYYLEAAATFDLGMYGLTLTPHIGRQHFSKGNNIASYTDISLALGKDFGNGFSGSLALYGTNADETFYTIGGKYLGKNGVVAGVKYAF
ncbi:MAG: hypothetical protein EOO28_23415 [Comamonadaceae bacterium]|nr:MAG: hypothetical protein EOO28_23415 [Comamonadaceae bacterium]